MRRAVIGIALAVVLATVSAAAMPPVDVEPWEIAPGTAEIGPGDPSPTGVWVPGNVYAATCDPWFASYYPGYYLWARVDWDTGWYSGTFYYYKYN